MEMDRMEGEERISKANEAGRIMNEGVHSRSEAMDNRLGDETNNRHEEALSETMIDGSIEGSGKGKDHKKKGKRKRTHISCATSSA
jgi:hypothetical protein